MKASDLLVACLETQGVKYIFGVPGEENLDLLESIRISSIKFIVTRDEQGACFMAATYGRLTGKAGVALSTLGPGATNLVTGVAYAQLGGFPLLVITGQKPIRKSKQGKFQIIDVVAMMKPITKFTASISDPNQIPALIGKAFQSAEKERPGAAHLELPEDIAAEETNGSPTEALESELIKADARSITEAVKMIQDAKSPLIILGAATSRKSVQSELKNLFDKTKIPFVTTQMGKGSVAESSELFLGTTALSANDYIHCAIDRADLVIVIGHDTIEKPPAIFTSKQKIIHINYFSDKFEGIYEPALEILGDINQSLKTLTEQLDSNSSWDFSYFKKLRSYMQKQLAEKSDSSNFPLLPQKIVADLRSVMPSDGILCLDNGMYKLWISRNYPAYEKHSVLLDNALASMGAGLPSAMAAKLLKPEKKVLAVCGDGGFMMNVAELETAKRLNLDLVVLILNDSGYGMISWKQQDMGFEDFGLKFGNPDFIKLTESFGATGHKITKAEDLLPTLKKALDTIGIHIIDCPIDYSENQKVFGEELKSKTCEI